MNSYETQEPSFNKDKRLQYPKAQKFPWNPIEKNGLKVF